MNPTQFAQTRATLGLSVDDMATTLGLSGANAADRIREMERGARPVTGPMQATLRGLLAANASLPTSVVVQLLRLIESRGEHSAAELRQMLVDAIAEEALATHLGDKVGDEAAFNFGPNSDRFCPYVNAARAHVSQAGQHQITIDLHNTQYAADWLLDRVEATASAHWAKIAKDLKD